MRDALSICLIVRNEEESLARCLDSIGDLGGEVVVVDTGSTDATPEIALRYGAALSRFDFSTIDFAAARNHAITQAQGRWILMLDADEVLVKESAPLIGELVAGNENDGYFLERLNHWSTQNVTTDYVVRLFPNRPDYRYRGRVHETIDAAILAGGARLRQSAIRLDHNFSFDPEARQRKNRLYIQVLKEEIAADPSDDSRLDFLAAEYHQLEMFAEAAQIAERIVELRPQDARAHLFAGVYHLLYTIDLPQARKDFDRALTLRPSYPEAEHFLQVLNEKERSAGQ